MTTKTYTADAARKHFREILDAVEFKGETVTITRFGEPVAQVVPMPESIKIIGPFET